MKYYAGIGSRTTPEHVLERMQRLAGILEGKGYTLRSGGAKGADSAFERGCGRSEIYLAREDNPIWCKAFTELFHPAPDRLSDYARQLMDRNSLIMLGLNGNTPVDFVVCFTDNGKAKGGTGQAIRMAQWLGITVYNFYNEEDIKQLKQFIGGLNNADQ